MKHRTHRLPIAWAVLPLALSLGPAAHAQPAGAAYDEPAGDTAANYAKRGKVAYDLQDWATAEREYRAAYGKEQKAEYLWALAQAQRQGGKYAAAIKTYKAFQRAGVTSNQANAAEMMTLKCEAEIAKAEAAAAKAAQSQSQEPSAPVAAASTDTPAQQPATDADAADESSGIHMAWFITGAVLTAGLGAVAIWSGTDTLSKKDDYEAAPTEDAYNDGIDLERRTNLLIGGTAIVGAATVVLAIFTDWSGSPTEPTEQAGLRLVPAAGETGGGLLLDGRF